MGQQSSISYTIPVAGGTITTPVTENVDCYFVTATGGAVSLTGNMVFNHSGTPIIGQNVTIYYTGGVTIGAYTLIILEYVVPATMALVPFTLTGYWDGSQWQMTAIVGNNVDAKFIEGYQIIDGSINELALTGNIPLSLLAATTNAYILQGNGTTVIANALSGDATITNVGVITIGNNAITTDKINDNAITTDKLAVYNATETFIIPVSFVTALQGAYKIKMGFPGTIIDIYATCTDVIAGTDAATVTPKNNAGTTMTVTTPIVFQPADAFGTAYDSVVTANNTFIAGDIITLTTAKTTSGGTALITLTILRS